MILPRLPTGLRALVEVIPPVQRVADVGAGHGAVSARLAAERRRVIAAEAGPGPLAELRRNLASWGAPVEARSASRELTWVAMQCVQDAELIEPWLRTHGRNVRTQLDAVERGRVYPTWVVDVPR